MKTSNILLIALLCTVLIVPVVSVFSSKYVSKEEFDKNLAKNTETFDAELYNYKKIAFDQPFNQIVIEGTRHAAANFFLVSVCHDSKYGLKIKNTSGTKIWNYQIKDGVLYLKTNDVFRNDNNLIIYTPKLNSITIKDEMVDLNTKYFDSNLTINCTEGTNSKIFIAGSYTKKSTLNLSNFSKCLLSSGGLNKVIDVNLKDYSELKVVTIPGCDTLNINAEKKTKLNLNPFIGDAVELNPLYSMTIPQHSPNNIKQLNLKGNIHSISCTDGNGFPKKINAKQLNITDSTELNMPVKLIKQLLSSK